MDWGGLWKLATLRRAPRRLDIRGWGVVCVVVHLHRWHGWKPRLLIALLPRPHRVTLQANFVLPLVVVRVVKGLAEHGCSFHPLVSLLSARLSPLRSRGKDWPHITAGFFRGFLLSSQLVSPLHKLPTRLHKLPTRSTMVMTQLLPDACLPLQ